MENQNTEKLTDKQNFEDFVSKLTSYGFRVIPEREKNGYHNAVGIVPPKGRKKRPGQVAMIFIHISGMKVFVWTTYSGRYEKLIDKGLASGWVLILDKDGIPRHKSRGIRRTNTFWNKLYYEAVINLQRVSANPWCSCGAPMKVEWNKDRLRGRYWRCSNPGAHVGTKLPTVGWNTGVTGKFLEDVTKRHKARRKYNLMRRKVGKNPYHAMLTRKNWDKRERRVS